MHISDQLKLIHLWECYRMTFFQPTDIFQVVKINHVQEEKCEMYIIHSFHLFVSIKESECLLCNLSINLVQLFTFIRIKLLHANFTYMILKMHFVYVKSFTAQDLCCIANIRSLRVFDKRTQMTSIVIQDYIQVIRCCLGYILT